MKKIILLFLVTICIRSAGQTCKYMINEVDKMTGKAVKQTKPAEIVKKSNVKGVVAFQNYGDEHYFILGLNYGSWGEVGNIDIKKDQEIILMLANGQKISLKNYKDRNGIVGNHSCAINDVYYQLTSDQVKTLASSNVTNIRYYRMINGSDGFEDFEIEDKDQKDFLECVKCVL